MLLFNSREAHTLASLIEAECGICGVKEKELVGSTVLNRMYSDDFPNTLQGVLTQKGQYTLKRPKPSPESLKVANKLLNQGSQYKKVLYFSKRGNKKLNMTVLFYEKFHKYGF